MPVDDALRIVTRYETRYTGWTVKHVHERWQTEHGTPQDTWSGLPDQAGGTVDKVRLAQVHRAL